VKLHIWRYGAGKVADRDTIIGSYEAGRTFLAVLFLRVVSVLLVMVTLQIRPTLPAWMLEWFGRISWPLLAGSLLLLIFHKKAVVLLDKYPWLLYADLLVSVGIIQIGGSWRSSYFGYTITTIILFTLFKGRAGAYFSAFVLILGATVKDPSGGLSSQEVFFVSDWDMRMGAALIYTTTGVILGYFYSLLKKIDTLSRQRISEAQKVSAMEEKTRLALELHDGAKQMVTAMLLMLSPLVKKADTERRDVADGLRWLWRGMNYLQGELNHVMAMLRNEVRIGGEVCLVAEIVKEEVRIAEAMTGFSWSVIAEAGDPAVPGKAKLPLRRFVNEAFMNSWKHSGVTSGTVEIRQDGAEIVITLSDQGKGFVCADSQRSGSMGLKSLESRAGELNGRFFIETAPNEGCRVILILPAYEAR
jgi:signal transduction histidine kinase